MDTNRYFYELLTEKRSAANKAKNQAEKRAAKEARRVRAGKPTGSKRGKDSYDGRTLSISGKSGEPGTGKGGVEQRKVTGKGYDDEAYSESVNYEDIYLELLGESVFSTYRNLGVILAEALGYSIEEGIQRDIRQQIGIEKMLGRTRGASSKKIDKTRDAGRERLYVLAQKAKKRAERYEGGAEDLRIGGKQARQKAKKIETHNPGTSAIETLHGKSKEEKNRARYIGQRHGITHGTGISPRSNEK